MRLLASLSFTLILLISTASAQEPSSPPNPFGSEMDASLLQNTAMKAYETQDYLTMQQALERLTYIRPYMAHFRVLLAKAYSLQDKKSPAFDTLLKLQKQGLYFDFSDDEDFANLRGLGVFDYILDNMEKVSQPYGTSNQVAILPSDKELVEAVAYDAERERWLFADSRETTIYAVNKEGEVSEFAASSKKAPLFSVFDLEVDPERNALWALSSVSPYLDDPDPRFAGRTFVVRYDLDSGKRTGTYRAREAVPFLDLAVSPRNGTVFAVTGATSAVWMLPADQLKKQSGIMEMLLNVPRLGALRTITIDDTGETLYFSNYELGVFGHKIREKRTFTTHMGEQLNLAGIDSMDWYDDSLIILQNGFEPHRLMRVLLDKQGRLGRHAQAMLSNLESFQAPTTMDVHEGVAYVVPNSNRRAFDPASGKKLDGVELAPHRILSTRLDYGWLPPARIMPQSESADEAGPATN